VDVYQLIEGKAEPVKEDDCIGCESCVLACDFDAITIEEIEPFRGHSLLYEHY
jgi:NAD-dependent dihydropyrimidine dehydrogenase PreA subunit